MISRSGLRACIRPRRGHFSTREEISIQNAVTHNSKEVSRKQQSNSMCFQICFIICDDWGIFSACAQFMEMMLFLVSFSGCIVRNQIDANSRSSRNSPLYVPPAAHQHRVCSISLSSGGVNRIAIVLVAFYTSQDIFATWWHSAHGFWLRIIGLLHLHFYSMRVLGCLRPYSRKSQEWCWPQPQIDAQP